MNVDLSAGSPRDGVAWPAGTLLARLGARARADLLDLGSPRAFGPGRVLIRQGEPGMHVYLLTSVRAGASACVKVSARLANGAESLLDITVSGDVVGEMTLLRGVARTATVTTCSPVRARVISGGEFLGFLARHEEAWPAVGGMVADRLVWANDRRLEFAGYPVLARLARALSVLTARHGYRTSAGHDLGVRLSHDELGKLIGAGRDAIGKAVARLRDEGLISVRYRRITVLALPALSAYADHHMSR
ncbi:Crp/Fnr family transcriptional regulator [Acrocarpospora catenulata]|uniref:Crp/Fnr family transcriptional regulator n=1 Tax=Acrocarpospora catenulata TaxID=2836182 RepID=UPI0027DFE4DD|nr:Crp/Fnr family transcriptional regulator [Acrocarpospora catenulata]